MTTFGCFSFLHSFSTIFLALKEAFNRRTGWNFFGLKKDKYSMRAPRNKMAGAIYDPTTVEYYKLTGFLVKDKG